MRRNMTWLIGALLFFFARPAITQSTAFQSDSLAILNTLDRQQDAWNRGDLDAFMKAYWKSDQLQFIGADGPTYGWQETLENYRRRYPDRQAMGTLTFSVLNLDHRSPTVVSLVGTFHLRREIGDLKGFFTLLWQQIDGTWLIVADHTSAAGG